ncbi:PTS sugar transporter subunit IIB [Enterococcus sp. AZ072]|uniref:PTS sugar transporter subunit IIB n=1 Tax=unclassified Enterococcus TaxID=2608891 RepID=UPI003D2D9F63
MKKVIVACGSGVATSQTVASKIGRLLNERKVNASVEAVDIKSIKTFIKNADAYVSITPTSETYGVPKFDGIKFLTGMGMEEELDKLIEELKK